MLTPAMFRIVDALVRHGPMNGRKLAERANVAFTTFKGHCKAVLIANGMIHQSGWDRYRYGYMPVYDAGVGRTQPRPVDTRNNAARCREWKARTGYCDPRNALRRIRRPPDPVLAALRGQRPNFPKQRSTST